MTAGLVVLAFSFLGGMLGAWVVIRPDRKPSVVGIAQSVVLTNGGQYIEISVIREDGSLTRAHVRPLATDNAMPLNTVMKFCPDRTTWVKQ